MEKTQIYFFLEELNSINIPLLKKLKNISIIYRNYSKQDYIARALKIKKFAKKQRHSLFVSNDILLAMKLDANLYIPNFNKQLRYLNHSCQKKNKCCWICSQPSGSENKKSSRLFTDFCFSSLPYFLSPRKKTYGNCKI